jgi:hypothetical protein
MKSDRARIKRVPKPTLMSLDLSFYTVDVILCYVVCVCVYVCTSEVH